MDELKEVQKTLLKTYNQIRNDKYSTYSKEYKEGLLAGHERALETIDCKLNGGELN